MTARRGQRGAAIITALLVVALVAIIASALLAQQSQALTRTAAGVARAQASAYSDTALYWACGILQEDARHDAQQKTGDHLSEPWAAGIAALPVENAVVSGTLSDAQGRFNLNNLVRNGKVDEPSVQLFRRLLEALSLPPDLAYAVVDWIDADSDVSSPGGAEDQTYLARPAPYRAANHALVMVDELAYVQGFDAKTLAKLRPFVSALAPITRINLNTAPIEVVKAVMPELSDSEQQALVKERLTRPFKDLTDIKARYPKAAPQLLDQEVDAKSSFFTAQIAVSSGTVQIRTQALIQRIENKWPVIIWTAAF